MQIEAQVVHDSDRPCPGFAPLGLPLRPVRSGKKVRVAACAILFAGVSAAFCALVLMSVSCSRTAKPSADDSRNDPWDDIRNDVKRILTPAARTIANSNQGDSIKYELDEYGAIFLYGYSRDDYPPEMRVMDLSSKKIQGFVVLTVTEDRIFDIRFQFGAPGAGMAGPILKIDDICVRSSLDPSVKPIVRSLGGADKL